jgi:hypothetical protein
MPNWSASAPSPVVNSGEPHSGQKDWKRLRPLSPVFVWTLGGLPVSWSLSRDVITVTR